MYLLDTNICIYAMKNRFPELTDKLMKISPKEIYVSSVTVGELEYGASKSKWGDRSRKVMNLFLSAYTILPFDEEDAHAFGHIRATLYSQGMPIGPYDLQIAAQGISKSLTIVTHNVEEFSRVPNIVLEDWTQS